MSLFCTKCGNEIKDGALFCTRCGASLVKPEPSDTEPVLTQSGSDIEDNAASPVSGNSKAVYIGITAAALLIIICIAVFVGRALMSRGRAKAYEPKDDVDVGADSGYATETAAPAAETAAPAADTAAPAADAEEAAPAAAEAAPADEAAPAESLTDTRELYGRYLYAYMKEYPEQTIVSGSVCDIDGDGISEMILLWDKGGSKTEEVLTIRTDIGADVISIFNTNVDYLNFSVMQDSSGRRFAQITNAKNVDYIIHDKGHEIFGTPASDGRYCMSQRYTANDRDYEPVSWNEELMYVYEDEWNDAWDRLMDGTDHISFDTYDTWIKGSMNDEEISTAFDSFWDSFGVREELNAQRAEGDFPDGCIGIVYITTYDPSGLNLHYTPDLDESSIDYDLGPVGAGYNGGMNGDMFYVMEELEGRDGNKMYLLDNDRYISASRTYTAFVPVD